MSYFVGDDKKVYYPFGKGGKDSILQSFDAVKSPSNSQTPSQADVIRRSLVDVPFHAFPLAPEFSHFPITTQSDLTYLNDKYIPLTNESILEILRIRLPAQLVS